MAQDDGLPSVPEKGKGKADDVNGRKGDGKTALEKDAKTAANGKVVDGLPEGDHDRELDRSWEMMEG